MKDVKGSMGSHTGRKCVGALGASSCQELSKESAVYIQIQMQTLVSLVRCLAFFGKKSSEIKGRILKESKKR